MSIEDVDVVAPRYTPDEDAIILANKDSAHTVALLQESGFAGRTTDAIKARRKKLRQGRHPSKARDRFDVREVAARHAELEDEIASLTARLEEARGELAECKALLIRLVTGSDDEVGDEAIREAIRKRLGQ
jgi:multidrug resistance efflux pump